MIVRVAMGSDGPSVVLDDVGTFTALHVAAEPTLADELDAALGDLGAFDGTHAWLVPAGLERLAGAAADDEWRAGLDATLAYAEANGFLAENGAVRAHVEWEP